MAAGDHLYVQCLGFTHHGIDLGDGTIIEYGGKGSSQMSVRRVWMGDFAKRGTVYVKEYLPGTTLSPNRVIGLAWTRLREQRYDLFNNNCEHLAYWCKTGRHVSPQVDVVKGVLTLGAIVGGVALLASA